MFCTNCGASNKDHAEFCANCGESFNEAKTKDKLPRMKVPNELSCFNRVRFLHAFYDFSFSQFVSPKIMKFLYGLSILFAGLISLLLVIGGFKFSMLFGIFSLLIGAPLVFFLMVIGTRVLLETILMIFQMADHLTNEGMINKGIIEREENAESRDGIQWNI